MISVAELAGAKANLRRHQKRLGCYPHCTVRLRHDGMVEQFSLCEHGDAVVHENLLVCHLPDGLIRDILDCKVHWNNAEIGCLIEFDRVGPYLPDVHTLMSFFHLPRS